MKKIALMFFAFVASCNYDTGECYLRDDGGDGAGGDIVTPPGTGGFGDVPPEPQDASDLPPECELAKEVRCSVPGSDACVTQCEAIGAYCVHHAKHPYSPSSGTGDLFWCKGGSPTWTCSWKYSNGDNCTRIYPFATWLCRYTGGK